MSSSSNITGLLAELINGTTPSPTPPTSVRNLKKVSLTTAMQNSAIRGGNDRTLPSINATKKAIVLKHVDTTPSELTTAGSETNWFTSMSEFLTNFGVSETISDAISETGVGNYPKYNIWILPDNISATSDIPIVDEDRNVINISNFPICSVKNTSISEELKKGALIRIDFENRELGSDAYIVSVMNNTEVFGAAIFNELSGIASPEGSFAPCNEQGVAVGHPTGDAMSTTGKDADLHNAYKAKERTVGAKNVSMTEIFNELNLALGNKNLAIGILANAKSESNFDANVVSGAATESSLGLWQMNVQSSGRVGTPNSNMASQASSLDSSIRIPSSSSVIRYFAGGLLATSKGVSIITPTDYDSTKDVGAIYDTVRSVDNQVEYVIESAQAMLAAIPERSSTIDAGQWAQWWQIYFEQPASIHDRATVARSIASDLEEAV